MPSLSAMVDALLAPIDLKALRAPQALVDKVIPFPGEISRRRLSAANLALAAVVITRKSTPRALGRCQKRVLRAIERLAAMPEVLGRPHPADAAEAIMRTCKACGRCPGSSI